MSPSQRTYFFATLWPAACREMGWDPNHRPTRMTFFRVELGSDKSFNDLTQSEFDLLKARCLAIARPADLDAQMAQARQPRLRLETKIGEHLRCLARYLSNPDTYDATLRRHRFHGQKMADMPARDLYHYCLTLNSRLNGATGFRAAAGESVHTMRVAVGLRCPCKLCAARPSDPSAHPGQPASGD